MNNFIQSHTHSDGRHTEVLAAEKVEYVSTSIKRAILRALQKQGSLTPDEFADATGALINTVRRRFTDLWKEGRIRHHPDEVTRVNTSGNECLVYVLGKDPDRRLSRYERAMKEARRQGGRDMVERLRERVEKLPKHLWDAGHFVLEKRDVLAILEGEE